ncbi:TonB-dependent receptor [Paucibacter sp. TC2R-5]|uniref:TonB-dependent receptor n=1 Tax=Paucibacter sp. TC2R-5 TaxID=2893555 RepID=UPI0021E4B3EA|nr:TonB-dependent receptor [Paucibacter sp. TC2R-5]MCV2359793.1 TonB-dependent receptor [Paucibacter sp. TC2R-5]
MNPRPSSSNKSHPHALVMSMISLAVLSLIGSAHAQEASKPAAASESRLDTISVTGFRASLETALRAKRDENSIVDVIKAEDMGKFPDTNLAESLQRVPGVVIDRDAGEGRSITVRGLGQDFTRVRINGIEALATTGGTDSSGGANRSRGFDFNVFAADLFSSLTVRKSSSADIDEGSLGATVDLQTTRPLDLKAGFTGAMSLKGMYNDLSGKTTPKASFLLSNIFADKKIGVLFSGAYSKREVLEEGFSTVRWDNGPSSGGWCPPQGATIAPGTTLPTGSTATTCGPAANGVPRLANTPANQAAYQEASKAENFHPRLPRYGRLTHDQERLGLTGSFQIKPAEGTLVTVDMLYSKLDATRKEDFLEAISFSRSLSQGGKPQTSVLATEYAPNGALLYGKYNGVDIRSESRFDQLSTTFTQPTLTLEQDLTDTLKLNARFGRATSKFRNPIQTTTTLDAANVQGYEMDFRSSDRLPILNYGSLNPSDPNGGLKIIGVPVGSASISNFTPSEVRIRPNGTTNTNDLAHLDLAWELNEKLTLKVGGDFKKFKFETYEARRTVETMNTLPAGVTQANLVTSLTGFGKGQSIPAGTITSWVLPDLNAISSAYDIYCNCLKTGAAGGPGDYTLTSTTNANARGNNRTVTETDSGGFAMADFASELGGIPLRGNVGVRYVKTKMTADGYLATAGGTPVTAENSYDDWLPAINVAANLSKNLILRGAAAKVMSRPQLANLSPGGTLSTTGTLTYTGGNPLLKPFRADTFDASLEWYHEKNAFVGLGLFQKNIKTYIQTVKTNLPYNQTGLPMSLLPPGMTGEEVFAVTSPVNTNGGKLSGFELNIQQPFSFLPAWGKNFGALFNYTYVKSQIEYIVSPTSTATITNDLINLSPRSYNTTLYYDDGTFSARVSGSQREAYLTRVPGQNNNDVEGKNKTFNVDASISYKVNDKLDITLEGVNLTNQPNDQYISSQRDSVVVNNVTGREYLIGFRYKF